jgi:hypothetical protein
MTARLDTRPTLVAIRLALLALALVAGGCGSGKHSIPQRTPPGGWTAVDAAGPHLDARDGAARDAGRDLAAEAGRDAASRDAASRDLGRDSVARDGGARDAAPARDAGADHAARAAAAIDGGARMCGQLTGACAPFTCDVDAGRCRYYCASSADCAPGRPCVSGLCGFKEPTMCASGLECASGTCADGVCCDTPCAGACHSCMLVATVGTCTAVPSGAVDPHGICSAGEVCGSDAACTARDGGAGH